MAPKSVTFRRHDHLVSVLFGDLLSHSHNITFSLFLDLYHNYKFSIILWLAMDAGLEFSAAYLHSHRAVPPHVFTSLPLSSIILSGNQAACGKEGGQVTY